jgi:uncharacterized membrane protein
MRLVLILMLLCGNCIAQTDNHIALEKFRNEYEEYILAANNLLRESSSIDPIVTDMIGRVIPHLADEDIDGAINEVATILYRRTGVKELNPAFITYIKNTCINIVNEVKTDNLVLLPISILNSYLDIDNYLKTGTVPYAIVKSYNYASHSSHYHSHHHAHNSSGDNNTRNTPTATTYTPEKEKYPTSFTVNNQTDETVSVAYANRQGDEFVSAGWIRIPPHQTTKLNVDNDSYDFYVCAYGGKSEWYGTYSYCVDTSNFSLVNNNYGACSQSKKFIKLVALDGEYKWNIVSQ